MTLQQAEDELKAALLQLEQVLAEEASALRSLDRDAIDRAAAQKLALHQQLETLRKQARPGQLDRHLLERVRRVALSNQLLLVHARNCVHGVLALAAGVRPAGYTTQPPTPLSDGLRLNMRG